MKSESNLKASKHTPLRTAGQLRKRLKVVGLLTFFAGIISAGIVYWLVSPPPDYSADPSMVGFLRPQRREMERLYGPIGSLMIDLFEELKQPLTQAILVLLGFTVIAGAILLYANRLPRDEHK